MTDYKFETTTAVDEEKAPRHTHTHNTMYQKHERKCEKKKKTHRLDALLN